MTQHSRTPDENPLDAGDVGEAGRQSAESGGPWEEAADPTVGVFRDNPAEPTSVGATRETDDDEALDDNALDEEASDCAATEGTDDTSAAADATLFPAADSAAARPNKSGLEPSDVPGAANAPSAVREAGVPETAAALTADRLLEPRNRPPASGWRRWLFTSTLGKVNVGDSDAVRMRRITEHRISAPLGEGTRYVPVLSRKGGVGKTTVTTLLGMALAQVREDRIIALDANPDSGTLTDRSPGKARHTARQLVRNRAMVDSFPNLSTYSAREGSRLHILASDTDPRVAEAFDDSDYRAVTEMLSKFYSIVLTDSGTGMVHSVMKGTLDKADAVVLVSGSSVDEARLASETLSWLEAHGRTDLSERAIVVINQTGGQGPGTNVEEIEAHFRTRATSVVRLPHDPHLAEGSRIDLDRLRPATRQAAMTLASIVVDELRR